uniref:Retrotransposon protein, putative, Ty1-copia subclass n=1 Tax=Tanacetum cinerariifolium TaxID=118510 RepID=A0A6L2NF96_TANCI|nr:retrotransposon protein, putative, Ty1-copia subclass [Tanacetum cinerariifolium]
MSQFCEMKGILRQFSVARTPQQNRVAERRNKTLIEASKTMLADFKLPTNFWAEAVSTACYMQNRVLVVKPHNKTPYEFFHGRTPITVEPPFSQDPKSSYDDGSKPASDDEKKVDEYPKKEGKCKDQDKEDNVNITNNVNTAGNVNTVSSTVNVAGTNEVNVVDDEDYGAIADMNHLDTTIQGELLQFKLQEVWTLVDLPNRKRAMGSKWVFKNKKDKKETVIRNKARLVAQGYTQEERIDYDEVFAPVAKIEAIRLFLAYASFKDFVVYQMEVKSAFIYRTIKEEVYVCRPPGFEDPDFLIEYTRFTEVKTASTSMGTQKPLLKDEDGKEVDVHMYRSMIGSLMYLTSLRPNIMFAVCACARYQVNPKVSHLHALKRIFSDSDYAGASLDRKSTTGGCQFFGCRLISWQYKKQTVVANSTTEAEYMFWSTAMAKTINGEAQLHALVDGKEIIITGSSIRRDLRLADDKGIDCLSNFTIFEQLTLMGYLSDPIKDVPDEAVHKELGDSLLEKKNRSKTHRLKRLYKVGLTAKVESYGNEESLVEDASKQGRINAINADEEITLGNVQDEVVSNDADKEMFDVDVLDDEKVYVAEHEVAVNGVNDEVNVVEEVVKVINTAKLIIDAAQDSVVGDIVSTAGAAITVSATTITTAIITTFGDITLVQALEEIKSTKPKGKGIVIQELGESTTTKSSHQSQDKGKGILIEPMIDPVKPMKRKDQIMLDEEAALKLQAAFDEEERIAREKAKKVEEANIALIETWKYIQAKIDVDH